MKNELVQMFEGQEVKIVTEEGNTLINLVHTAKACGLTKTANSGNEVVRFDRVKQRLSNIKSCPDVGTDKITEIEYVLDEIENTDDRNSIYMSSWLTRRIAMECNNDKAMNYKNFLATLDEKFSKGQLSIQANNMQIATMVSQVMNQVLPTLTKELATQFLPMIQETKEQVNNMASLMHDQSTIYDDDREELKSLIGLRSKNTQVLTNSLKDKLSSLTDTSITAKSTLYIKYKEKVFKEFKVCNWESISVSKFNAVHAYIDSLEIN
jgi:hypothetical protein